VPANKFVKLPVVGRNDVVNGASDIVCVGPMATGVKYVGAWVP